MDNNRLLLQLEQTRKEINRSVINPEIQTLSQSDVQPIIEMVAHARAAYVAELFSLARATEGKQAPEDITRLQELGKKFDELVKAANALETMIKRGYVDVEGTLG